MKCLSQTLPETSSCFSLMLTLFNQRALLSTNNSVSSFLTLGMEKNLASLLVNLLRVHPFTMQRIAKLCNDVVLDNPTVTQIFFVNILRRRSYNHVRNARTKNPQKTLKIQTWPPRARCVRKSEGGTRFALALLPVSVSLTNTLRKLDIQRLTQGIAYRVDGFLNKR